ncbi:hypothetical protein Btru_054404 [Bulinus truncatus]|nr:hypothetical protein Btru_054404 [Bulinus truncatus]
MPVAIRDALGQRGMNLNGGVKTATLVMEGKMCRAELIMLMRPRTSQCPDSCHGQHFDQTVIMGNTLTRQLSWGNSLTRQLSWGNTLTRSCNGQHFDQTVVMGQLFDQTVVMGKHFDQKL